MVTIRISAALTTRTDDGLRLPCELLVRFGCTHASAIARGLILLGAPRADAGNGWDLESACRVGARKLGRQAGFRSRCSRELGVALPPPASQALATPEAASARGGSASSIHSRASGEDAPGRSGARRRTRGLRAAAALGSRPGARTPRSSRGSVAPWLWNTACPVPVARWPALHVGNLWIRPVPHGWNRRPRASIGRAAWQSSQRGARADAGPENRRRTVSSRYEAQRFCIAHSAGRMIPGPPETARVGTRTWSRRAGVDQVGQAEEVVLVASAPVVAHE